MVSTQLGAVVRHVRGMAEAKAHAGVTDGQLLEGFIRRQENEAFAALLRRHGPMVLGVCRRVLRREQDAEDVFQASFLLLARKAGSIRKRESVGSWLHGVAYRLAMKAKGQRAQRQWRERQVMSMRKPRPEVEKAWRELQEMLDEAIEQLPPKYRTALILCYLQGRTHAEAARQLGCPLATLQSWLARGRKLLRDRLSVARGLAPSAGAIATLLAASTAEAGIRAPLLRHTLDAALQFASGEAAGTVASQQVTALVESGLKAMAETTKLRVMTTLLLGTALAVAGAGVLAHQPVTAELPPAQQPEAPRLPDSSTLKREARPRTDNYGDPLPPGALARMGTTRFRHGDAVGRVAYLDRGKTLASWHVDGTLYLWEAATGKELRRHPLQHAVLNDWRVLPDGQALAVLRSGDGKIYLWDFASKAEPPDVKPFPQDITITGDLETFAAFAISPDGKLLAGGTGGYKDRKRYVQLWEAQPGKELNELKALRTLERNQDAIEWLAFSPDGKQVAAASRPKEGDDTLTIWEVATGKEVRRFAIPPAFKETARGEFPSSLHGLHPAPPAAAWSPDGRVLALGLADKTVRLWDVTEGKELRRLDGHESSVLCVAFSPDGKTLASASWDRTIRLWDVATGKQLHQWQQGKISAQTLAFSPDGKTLASGSEDHIIRVWDVATGKQVDGLGGHEMGILAMALAPDGKTLATGAYDGAVRLWDPATGKEIRVIAVKASGVSALAFTPDGKTLVGADNKNIIRLWDTASGEEVRHLAGHKSFIYFDALAVSADGRWVASGSRDHTARLWDVAAGKELRQFTGHQDEVTSVAISPDGQLVASVGTGKNVGDPENCIRLWDSATGKELRQFRPRKKCQVGSVAFSPDGKYLASAGTCWSWGGKDTASPDFADALHLWEAVTGKLLRQFPGAPAKGGTRRVNRVAFSPDGRMLATAELNGAVMLYETATGKLRRQLDGHRGDVRVVAFSGDGRRLASASEDLTALLWDLTGQTELQGVKLSAKEREGFWADLASNDAAKAYRAMLTLAAEPERTAAYLKERLKPAVDQVDPQRLADLIADLDSDRFTVREKAAAELEKLGEAAEPALRKALQGQPSAEVRRRVELLLDKLDRSRGPEPTPERLQALRALEILELLGLPEARPILETLAKGAPSAWLTEEAKASLDRLKGRRTDTP